MDNIVIVAGSRTAVGNFGGALKDHSASDLGAITIKSVIEKAGLKPEQIDEVVFGSVGQIAENAFISRTSALKAGVPSEATALSVNRLCASGLQAILTAAQEIQMGFCEVAVAGGTESMSTLPYYVRNGRFGYRMGHGELEDGLITILSDPITREHMGVTAENVAERYKISREEQDAYAVRSQQKGAAARDAGKFIDEIVPITVKISRKEERIFDVDEYIRDNASIEGLAKLKPCFKKDGTVTAGNASGINDGAAAVIVMKESKAKELGLKPIVKIVDAACAGVDPAIMGIGPVPAVKKLLSQTKLDKSDIGLFELNEAFASQSLACIKELGLDESKVNVNGSGISIGHPIGATGTIITIKLMNEMVRRKEKYGIATLCIGGGQGLAVLFELCS